MKGNKVGWLIFAVIVSLFIVTGCIILYQKTDIAKRMVEWFNWFYDGLRNWHWE